MGLPAIPGPVDRVHFLDAQRRARRSSWRFAPFAVSAALFSGVPLSILLSPIVFALTLVGAHLVDLVFPLSPGTWATLDQLAHTAPDLWRALRGEEVTIRWPLLLTVLLLPGAALMLIAWMWIRLLFRRVGVGGTLERLGARAPDSRVLREAQLVNIVEELAIAAVVRPPRVLLIDSGAANVAAVGLTIHDATIVVSTGLLELEREERQAILAHVIGSVANGDLEIAAVVLSVFQTWGLLALLIDTPFGPRSRDAVRQFFAASSSARRDPESRRKAAVMLDRLLDGAGMTYEDLYEHTDLTRPPRPVWVQVFADLPLYLTLAVAAVASKAVIALFTLLVFGPWVARLWRARRRLADATAVQLTRHPDALARAVRSMEGRDVAVEGGTAVSFLFPFWTRWSPEVEPGEEVMSHVVGTQLELEDRLRSLWKLGATGDAADALARPPERRKDEERKWKSVLKYVGWGLVAVLLVGACVAFNLASTSLLIWGIWALLRIVFGG